VLACASATNAAQNPASFFERAIANKRVGPASPAQVVHWPNANILAFRQRGEECRTRMAEANDRLGFSDDWFEES
jgi:hypothetical protein